MNAGSTPRPAPSDTASASTGVSAPAKRRSGVASHCSKIAAFVAVRVVGSNTSKRRGQPPAGIAAEAGRGEVAATATVVGLEGVDRPPPGEVGVVADGRGRRGRHPMPAARRGRVAPL